MNIKSVLLPLILTSGLIACDANTVEVLSVGDENTDAAGDNPATDSSGETVDNESTDSGDVTDSTDASADGSVDASADESADGVGTVGADGMLSDPDRLLSMVGMVKLDVRNAENNFTRGTFSRLESALTAQEILEYFVPENDLCTITTYNAAFPPGDAFKIYDQQPTLISAGENITLTSSAGTYATLERQIVPPAGLIYQSNAALDENIPTDLLLNVPGEVFPGFSNVAISTAPALQVTSPTSQLTGNTEFVWNANNDPLSVLGIYAGFTTPETNVVTEIGCAVIDDGQFSFDEATRAALGEGYTADWFSFLRIVYDVVQSEEGIVFVANAVN